MQDAGPQDMSLDAGPNDVTSDISDGGPVDVTRDASTDIPPFDGPITGCPVGGPCSFAGACCTLACPPPSPPDAGRTCTAGPQCSPAGEACLSNADCCADRCGGGICEAFPPGDCLPAGERCGRDDSCCGGSCTSVDGGDDKRCALLPGACRVLGEVCVTQFDCCSGRCGSVVSGGVRICLVARACNLLDGRVCSGQAGDRCTTMADCCGDQCAPGAGIGGVLRCANPAGCGGTCALCIRDSDCCSGRRCVSDVNGDQRCE